jgi:hypothetical protein
MLSSVIQHLRARQGHALLVIEMEVIRQNNFERYAIAGAHNTQSVAEEESQDHDLMRH